MLSFIKKIFPKKENNKDSNEEVINFLDSKILKIAKRSLHEIRNPLNSITQTDKEILAKYILSLETCLLHIYALNKKRHSCIGQKECLKLSLLESLKDFTTIID